MYLTICTTTKKQLNSQKILQKKTINIRNVSPISSVNLSAKSSKLEMNCIQGQLYHCSQNEKL